MRNIKTKINDNILLLEIDLTKEQYESGKTTIVATSEGDHPIEFNGDIIRIGVVVYK